MLTRRTILRLSNALWLCGLGACASTTPPPPEPRIVVKEVKVPQPVPCPALAELGPEPVYPDTDAALAGASGIGELAKLYAQGRVMRIQRLAEYSATAIACTF